jgi:uncharacterized protein YlbG (UPF0298 family)
MANRQRGPLPPVMSTEETRVKPPEEDEEEVAPEDEPSFDPQRDQTQLVSRTGAPAPPLDWSAEEEGTPIMPTEALSTSLEDPDDATRPIPRKTGARPALQTPDDATRPIPRKTASRPGQPDPDATGLVPRKMTSRPGQPDPDATGFVPRKPGPPSTRVPAIPWEPKPEDDVAFPTTAAQPLPPIIQGTPGGPPVLSPVGAAPPRVPAALFGMNTQPNYVPDKPPVLEPVTTEPVRLPRPAPYAPPVSPVFTQPNYVSPPSAPVAPIVTAPHLSPSAPIPQNAEPPPEGDLRTAFSNKAAMIADLIKATFARRSYGTAPYRLRIDEPDGPSTGGGRQARQPISLVATMDSAPAVVCGWVDVAKKESQLRSYGVVAKRHKSRYGAVLDINEEEYERFLNELVDTLFYGGIKIVVQVPEEPDPQQQAQSQGQVQPQAKGGRSCLGTLLLLSLTFALGVGAGLNAERFAPLIQQLKALTGQR